MISFEIDFLFYFASLFFLYHTLSSVSQRDRRDLLLLYWMGISVLSFLVITSFSRFEIFFIGWNKRSTFQILTLANLLLFFTYRSLEERIFSYSRSVGFIFTALIFGFFASFFYWMERFQTNLYAEDESHILPFAIAVGAFVWSREMFWTEPKLTLSPSSDEKEFNLTDSLFPCLVFLIAPQTTNYEFVAVLASVVVIGLSSLVGFIFVSQILKERVPREGELGMWIGTLAFSTSIGVDLLVSVPLSFSLGMFGRGVYHTLARLDWSEPGKRGVVSFLYPSILGIFLPFLVLEPKHWNHAPYVLLGVQVLYFFSFYLVSSFVFGILLLFKPKSE